MPPLVCNLKSLDVGDRIRNKNLLKSAGLLVFSELKAWNAFFIESDLTHIFPKMNRNFIFNDDFFFEHWVMINSDYNSFKRNI